MNVHYINLDTAGDRRRSLEESFAIFAAPGWSLHRVEAVHAAPRPANAPAASPSAAEMANWQSHVRAMECTLSDPLPALVVEDDTSFGPSSCGSIERMLEQLSTSDWDVLFTDVVCADAAAMVSLFRLRRELASAGRQVLLDLSKLAFAGMSGYIVRPQSRAKLLGMVRRTVSPQGPLDLTLRHWVYDGSLRAFAIFPFATSLSAHGDVSQIQPEATRVADLAFNAFRRLTWADADSAPDDATAWIDRLDSEYVDYATRKFTALLGVVLSKRFVSK